MRSDENVLAVELVEVAPDGVDRPVEVRGEVRHCHSHHPVHLGGKIRLPAGRELAGALQAAPPPGSLLPCETDTFFRLKRVRVSGSDLIDAGFAVLVVAEGSVSFSGYAAPCGSTWLMPADAGLLELDGVGEILVARPPVSIGRQW